MTLTNQAVRATADEEVAHDNETHGPTEAAVDVQRFYDRHPYPPPVTNLDRYRQLWLDPNRRRAEYHLLLPDRPYREDMEILIAGCGTSQAAKLVGHHRRGEGMREREIIAKVKYALSQLTPGRIPIVTA